MQLQFLLHWAVWSEKTSDRGQHKRQAQRKGGKLGPNTNLGPKKFFFRVAQNSLIALLLVFSAFGCFLSAIRHSLVVFFVLVEVKIFSLSVIVLSVTQKCQCDPK